MKVHLRRREIIDSSYLSGRLHSRLCDLYALRGVKSTQELERGLDRLLDYRELTGISTAVDLLQQALVDCCQITIVGDFDADGATSTAVAVLALRSMGAVNVNYLIPNRFEDGYGLSCPIVEQAAACGARLIITVDNGISSCDGVDLAIAKGIRVIVTDHHLPGERLPAADAIVNPNLPDCAFPSRTLAGVGVIFYVMLALRARLRDCGWFEQQALAIPRLAELLDLVALGTVADIVPLDANNRILVYQGIRRIRAGQCRQGIRALLEVSKLNARQLVASDLGFSLGPRLNAAGRLEDMSMGVALLLSDDECETRRIAIDLDRLNHTRRAIEQTMQVDALQLCSQLEQQPGQLPYGIVMYHPEWHQGVVGILASRIKERFHRPVIAFAPAGDGILKGSARSIAGLHMRDVLERLSVLHPGLIDKFGGHAMAAGLSLQHSQFDKFRQCFATLVSEYLDISQLEGIIWSDGELTESELSLEFAELLREGGPWGQAFPEPLFDGDFRILQQRLVGERHLKLTVEPLTGGPSLDGIAFNIDTELWPDNRVHEVKLAYKLGCNEFRGNTQVQLVIVQLWRC